MADDPLRLTDDYFDTRFGAATPAPTAASPPQPGVPQLTTVPTPQGPQPVPAPTAAAAPAPPWTPGGAPARPNVPGASPELNQAITAATQNIGEREQRLRQREAAEGPVIDAAMKQLDQPLPQRPQTQQPPPVPKREEILSGVEQWMMALATAAGVMGGRGRNHAVNAMAAMTGAIDGLSEGSKEKFEQNMKVWDAENKRVEQINAQSRQEYLDTLNDRKLRTEEMSMRLQLIAQRYDDKVVQSLGSDYERIANLIQARDQLNQTAAEYTSGLRTLGGRFGAAGRPSLSSEAIDLSAAMFFVGNPNATRGMSALSGDPVAVRNRLAAAQSGAQPFPPELLAEARKVTASQLQYRGQQSFQTTAGSMGARVEQASDEVVSLLPQALEASDALPRGKWVALNVITQKYLQGTSDPAYNNLIAANNGLMTAYAKAMNPTGVPREGDKHIMDQIGLLNVAVSPEAYRTQLLRMAKEVQASKRAVARTRSGEESTDLQDLIDDLEKTSPLKGMTPSTGTTTPLQNKTPGGIMWGPG
jgi:hypothetical protein